MPHPNDNGPFTAEDLAETRRAISRIRAAEAGSGFRRGLRRTLLFPLRAFPLDRQLEAMTFVEGARFGGTRGRRFARAADSFRSSFRRFLEGR